MLIAALWPFDEQVTAWVKNHYDEIKEWFPTTLVLLGGIIGFQGIRSMPNGDRLLVGFLTPVIISTALTHLLKFAIGRARPFLGDGATTFLPGIGGGEYASFPSGHTQYAFVVATIWVLHWPKLRWIAFLWAPAVGFERIWSEKHFLSDVLAGAAIGGFTAFACSYLLGQSFYRIDWKPAEKTAGADAEAKPRNA